MQAPDFTLSDQSGAEWKLSRHLDTARLVVFLRGDWWPYCNGQLVSLSNRYEEVTEAGGRIAVISVDSPGQNAAMIEKLQLPFPLLSDPDRTGAIEPFGVSDPKDPREIARPSLFVVTPESEVVFRETSRDFADRASEDAAIAALAALDLPATVAEDIELGPIEPGPRAMPLHAMEPYFRGAKFAVTAMKMRHADVAEDAGVYIAQMDRYIELVRELRGKS